jgi:hypothetical protein
MSWGNHDVKITTKHPNKSVKKHKTSKSSAGNSFGGGGGGGGGGGEGGGGGGGSAQTTTTTAKSTTNSHSPGGCKDPPLFHSNKVKNHSPNLQHTTVPKVSTAPKITSSVAPGPGPPNPPPHFPTTGEQGEPVASSSKESPQPSQPSQPQLKPRSSSCNNLDTLNLSSAEEGDGFKRIKETQQDDVDELTSVTELALADNEQQLENGEPPAEPSALTTEEPGPSDKKKKFTDDGGVYTGDQEGDIFNSKNGGESVKGRARTPSKENGKKDGRDVENDEGIKEIVDGGTNERIDGGTGEGNEKQEADGGGQGEGVLEGQESVVEGSSDAPSGLRRKLSRNASIQTDTEDGTALGTPLVVRKKDKKKRFRKGR